MSEKICQSCGRVMDDDMYGTYRGGTKSTEYCCFCFKSGEFTSSETMEQMVELSVRNRVHDGSFKTPEEARAYLSQLYPTLKRWKKYDE